MTSHLSKKSIDDVWSLARNRDDLLVQAMRYLLVKHFMHLRMAFRIFLLQNMAMSTLPDSGQSQCQDSLQPPWWIIVIAVKFPYCIDIIQYCTLLHRLLHSAAQIAVVSSEGLALSICFKQLCIGGSLPNSTESVEIPYQTSYKYFVIP